VIIYDIPSARACDNGGLAREDLGTGAILESSVEVGVGLEINKPSERSASLLRELLDLLEHTSQSVIRHCGITE
jgi:hypothetical protein